MLVCVFIYIETKQQHAVLVQVVLFCSDQCVPVDVPARYREGWTR